MTKQKNPLRQVIIMDHDPDEEVWKKAKPECIWLTSALASYQCQCHELRKKSSSKSSKSVFTLTAYSWEIWNHTKKEWK